MDSNSTITILSPRLTSGEREVLFICEQMPATAANHMTETAHQIICFLSAEIPLIFQLRDFYLFWIGKYLDSSRDRSWKHTGFLISLVNNNNLQLISCLFCRYCDICSIWDCSILATVIYPVWIYPFLFMMNCFGKINECCLQSFLVADVHYLWFQ